MNRSPRTQPTPPSRLRNGLVHALVALSVLTALSAPFGAAAAEGLPQGCAVKDDRSVAALALFGLILGGPVGMIAVGSEAQKQADREHASQPSGTCVSDTNRKPADMGSDSAAGAPAATAAPAPSSAEAIR